MPEQLALELAGFGAARSAVLSPCRRYRYRLDRRWGPGPTVCWIMLNPSTADAQRDDATIRRITAYSRGWGFGALTVANLYAWRSRHPAALWDAQDPVGPDNDAHLTGAAADCALLVAAWGAHARPDRIAALLALPGLGELHALELTQAGQPKHPLYLRGDLTPRPWRNPHA